MDKCINCKKECEKKYELAIVRSKKEGKAFKKTKVEEIVGLIETSLCDDCLNKYIKDCGSFKKQMLIVSIFPIIIIALMSLMIYLNKDNNSIFISILLMVFIGGYTFITGYRDVKKKADLINNSMSPRLRKQLASEMIIDKLPLKDKEGKLAYVMVDRVLSENLTTLASETEISEGTLTKIKRLKKNQDKNKGKK